MALVVGGEDDGAVEASEVFEAFGFDPGEEAGEREDQERQGDAAERSGGQASVPAGNSNDVRGRL